MWHHVSLVLEELKYALPNRRAIQGRLEPQQFQRVDTVDRRGSRGQRLRQSPGSFRV